MLLCTARNDVSEALYMALKISVVRNIVKKAILAEAEEARSVSPVVKTNIMLLHLTSKQKLVSSYLLKLMMPL